MYLEDSKSLGEELEREFTKKAREGGLTEDETRSAFNQNVSPHREGDAEAQMISTGMVAKDLGQFTKERGAGRKWLIGDYQAGDAVFHHSCKHSGAVWMGPDIRHDTRWRRE
jgi:phytanoyl-CoA hydroxylase